MQYSQQLYYKQNKVLNRLKRTGKIALLGFEPILGSDKQFYTETKREFSFSNNLGFVFIRPFCLYWASISKGNTFRGINFGKIAAYSVGLAILNYELIK